MDLHTTWPKNTQSLARFRQAVGTALRHMLCTDLPKADEIVAHKEGEQKLGDITVEQLRVSSKNAPAVVPAIAFIPARPSGPATIVVSPGGKRFLIGRDGKPHALVSALLGRGHVVLGLDVFMTGQLSGSNSTAEPSVELPAGGNRTVLGNRVRDLLTAVTALTTRPHVAAVNVIGLGRSGPWCLSARALAGDAISRCIADGNQFDFDKAESADDENWLPGALRCGGIWTLSALGAPGELFIYNTGLDATPQPLGIAYEAAGAKDKLRIERTATLPQMVEWIAR